MRSLLLAVVAGLAVLAVRINAEDVVPVEDAELEIDLDEDMMARMLGDLFDDVDFEDALEQQESNREARARGDEIEKAVEEEKAVDPKDQARYNSFIDTFFRRLNSFARSRFDPLSVGLEKTAKKGGKNAKSSNNKNKGKKGKSNKGKKGNKKSGKKGKKEDKDKNKKKRKNGRHPKDLDLGEEEENSEDQVPVEAEEDDEDVAEAHNISKREVEFDLVEIEEEDDDDEESDLEEDDEEESEVRIARSADMEDDASSPAEETSRRGKPAKGKKDSAKKGGKKNGGKKRKGGKKNNNKKSSNKNNNNKKGRKNKSKSKRDAKGSASRTSRASVTGIATVRRQGDVKVSNKQGGKEMRAQFTLGPVDLKVNRKFGKGKDAVTKEARAVSPELTGKLAIQVAASGKAKMTSFRINRPAIVQVEGSLRKSTKGGKSDNNFMERSIARFSPVASKKLKIASREILSAGEPKAQSEK